MKRILFAAVIVVMAAGGFLIYSNFLKEPEIKVLETASVERGGIKGVIVETGIIKPQVGALVKIGARSTGAISEMRVKIGDRVKKGELIALIDDREILQAIDQQKAAVKEAIANYEYARIFYERESELLKHEFTTKDSVDKAKSQLEAIESNIKEKTAQLRQQETKLTYARIYSPMDGVVSDVTAQKGETIVAGLQVANLVTVLDPSLLEMWVYVDETDIGRVKLGQPVEYYVDTFPDKIFHGNIEKIYPQPVVKDNIVYYLATVKMTREDAISLRPEMTTHVKIIFDEKQNILTAPNAAVKFEKGKQVAYKVIAHNKVQKVDLKTGIRGEDKTEIISGVKEGDKIATKLILPIGEKEQKSGSKNPH